MCLFLACCSWQTWIMGSTAPMLPCPFSTWVIGCLTSWITVSASWFCSSGCLSSQRLDLCFISSPPDVCDPNPCFNGGSCQMKSGGEFECFCLEPYGGKRCQKGQGIHRKVWWIKCVSPLMDLMYFQSKTFARMWGVATANAWSTWKSIPTMSASANPPFKDPAAWHVSRQQSTPVCSWFASLSRGYQSRETRHAFMSVPASPCEPNPCKNGASCIKGDRRFQCACPEGYTGKFCETGQPSLTHRSRSPVISNVEIIPPPHPPGVPPHSFHWLLLGERGDIQGYRQHDRRRARVSELEFLLYFDKRGGSLQPVLRL